MWGLAKYVANLLRGDTSSQAFERIEPPIGSRGPAVTTSQKSNSDGENTWHLIESRSMKATNKSLRGLYLSQHKALMNGKEGLTYYTP